VHRGGGYHLLAKLAGCTPLLPLLLSFATTTTTTTTYPNDLPARTCTSTSTATAKGSEPTRSSIVL
jgi:hypothetical protein